MWCGNNFTFLDSLQAKIRLKYRISYNQNGQEVVEMGEASDFPSV